MRSMTISGALCAAALFAQSPPPQAVNLSPGTQAVATCPCAIQARVSGNQATVTCPAVQPTPVAVTSLRGVAGGQTLSGTVRLEAVAEGPAITQVVFRLTGAKSASHTDRTAPYTLFADTGWDTTAYPNGDYTLTATATNTCGQTAAFSVTFRVSNAPPVISNQACPESVHARYTATGPDGVAYPTWHPPVDPATGCFFEHEHGSDPRKYVAFASSGMPLFGYTAARMGMTEPHNGFKVYVTNDDLNGRAWMITLHMGTGSPRRAVEQRHTLDWHIGTLAGAPLADLRLLADFGYAVPNCNPNAPIPGSIASIPFSVHNAQRRSIPTTTCAAQTPYEIWDARVNVGGLFEATPSFDADNPTTVVNPNDLTQTRFMCEFRSPGEDCASPNTQWSGSKRGVIHPGQLARNNTGSAVFYTDAHGTRVAEGTPGAIRQYLVTTGWDTRNCCGHQVVFRNQSFSGGVYIAAPPEATADHGVGRHRWPN